MKEKTYKLKLFTNALGAAREKSRFTYLNFYGQTVDIPYIIWYIEGADKKILIDAGCSAADYNRVIKGCDEKAFIAGGEKFKDVTDVTPFEKGLAGWGLKPEDIDVIIMTHLHWDHIMGAAKCKNAKIVVQEKEWRDAYYHHQIHHFAFAPRWYYEQMRNLEFVDGDVEFMPGIRLIFTPGHTAGGQSVAVFTDNGWYAVTGYCAIKHNFYPPEEIKNAIGYPIIPASVHTNSIQAYDSSLKLLNMFGNKVLPSHEQDLMKVREIPGDFKNF
jgi:N-acyl homoserine lactone hydrolase